MTMFTATGKPSVPKLAAPSASNCACVTVSVEGRRKSYHELTGEPEITVSTVESSDPDWFDLGILVKIDGRTIPFEPLFTALSKGRKKLLLVDGSYFSLNHRALDRLRELIDESGDDAEATCPRPRTSPIMRTS